jgi:hypothetical protein
MVNFQTRVLMVRSYQLTLKYPYYKKDANLDVHVKVFNVVVRENGETISYWCIITC